jgi:hypothetical protein
MGKSVSGDGEVVGTGSPSRPGLGHVFSEGQQAGQLAFPQRLLQQGAEHQEKSILHPGLRQFPALGAGGGGDAMPVF